MLGDLHHFMAREKAADLARAVEHTRHARDASPHERALRRRRFVARALGWMNPYAERGSSSRELVRVRVEDRPNAERSG
jgi:hypothetical protein